MKPEVKDYVGQYVRAVYDFDTTHPREITLRKGDIIKVTSAVDSNWLCGSQNGQDGNFPASFVEKLSLPAIQEGQKLFGATENFPAQQEGDLEFRKGALVVGTKEIDGNWWQGQIGTHSGIFPLTHVMELELPSVLRERTKSVHSSEPVFAQALCDSVAQLDEELGFKAGDLITVLEVIDNDWYYGELGSKQGMFLSSCVELIQDTSTPSNSDPQINENRQSWSSDNKMNILQKSYSFDQSYYGNLSDKQSNSSKVIKNSDPVQSESVTHSYHQSSSSPHKNVEIIVENERSRSLSEDVATTQPSAENAAYTSENTRSLDSSVNPYAMTLYPFAGQSDDELSFNENEIVYLIQHVDSQWTEGELDGKIGLFPTSFVSIIVDCPYAFSAAPEETDENVSQLENRTVTENSKNDHQDDLQKNEPTPSHDRNSSNSTPINIPCDQSHDSEIYALVLHTFDAETEGDLSVKEGDTVIVVKYIDDNWLQVRDEHGSIGMCPQHFVEVITGSPDLYPDKTNNKTTSGTVSKTVTGELPDSKIKENEISPSENLQNIEDKKELKVNNVAINGAVHEQKKQLSEKSTVSVTRPSVNKPSSTKPPLGPKPILKPKPSVLPKPAVKFSEESKPSSNISLMNSSAMQKSSSTHSLNMTGHAESAPAMQKSHSSTELNVSKQEKNAQEKATFENIDLSKSLSAIVSEELSRAKEDAEARSRSSSEKSSSSTEPQSGIATTQSGKVGEEKRVSFKSDSTVVFRNKPENRKPVIKNRHSVNFPLSSKSSSNQTRDSLSHKGVSSRSSVTSQYSAGLSTFFLDPTESEPIMSKPPMRKPPPIPQRSFEQDFSQFDRKPSLRKAPPPRPTGPRLAAAPSKEPLIPEKIIPQSTVPSKTTPARPQRKVPSRPAPAHPAPTRPQDTMPQPRRPPPRAPPVTQSNITPFGSQNQDSIAGANEEIVSDLKKKIKDIEMDLENFKKSRDELQEKLQDSSEEESQEIQEDIEFHDANISGLTEEVNKLREDLQKISPEEYDLAAKQMLEEARLVAEEKRREEERQREEEMKVKRKDKRQKVIEELIQTEKDFLQSLQLCLETFCSPEADKHIEVDIDIVFGNMEDIADISQRLLTSLEEAVQGREFGEQVIGSCFVLLSEDMKIAYAPYCRNHDEAITLMNRYNENPSVSQYFENMLNRLRERCVVFDLEALLIKPVQRILKYPLLLNELFKSTETDHVDHPHILNAINHMTDVATAINEYKRRKDLVVKYKKDTDESFGDKLAKLSFHSLKKKGSRFKGRLSTNLGLSPQTKDEAFDKEEIRFRHLEKIVKVFVRDVQSYMEQVQESVGCHECLVGNILDFYDDKQSSVEVVKFQQAQEAIDQKFLPLFVENVREMVTSPLLRLSQMFEAPNKVIQKRFDKLLDYDSMLRKSKDEKASEKALQATKKDYEALNAQLLDELPKLYSLSFQLLQDCIWAFVAAQRDYTNSILLHISDMLDKLIRHESSLQTKSSGRCSLPSLLSANDNVVEVFNIRHVSVVDKLSALGFIPKGFNPKYEAVKQADKKGKRQSIESSKLAAENTSAQTDSQKVYLRQQYPPDKLFNVTQTYQSTDLMDISLFEGDIVGIIVEKDPMGNKDRWFVDNGVAKGFIPSYILKSCPKPATVQVPSESQLYPAIPQGSMPISPILPVSPIYPSPNTQQGQSPKRPGQLHLNVDQISEDLDDFLEEDMTPDISDEMNHSLPECHEFYYAEFEFQGRTGNEVSLFEGQVVTVLAKHDEENNTDWWYVDADGVKGYAPSAYLQPMK